MPIALFQDLLRGPHFLVGPAGDAQGPADLVEDVLIRRRDGTAGRFLAHARGALPVGVRVAARERRTRLRKLRRFGLRPRFEVEREHLGHRTLVFVFDALRSAGLLPCHGGLKNSMTDAIDIANRRSSVPVAPALQFFAGQRDSDDGSGAARRLPRVGQRAFAVVNPAAGAGATRRLWPGLAAVLSASGLEVDAAMTTRPAEGIEFARRAVDAGHS